MAAAAALFAALGATAQTPSVVENIRIPVWAERDAYPGLAEAQDLSAGEWDYPRERIRAVAAFLVGGMANGWRFEYMPYDKARGVPEFFEFEDIRPLGDDAKRIRYTQTWVEDGKVQCWIEFERTEQMLRDWNLWSSINNPVVGGTGYGSVMDGFDGIIDSAKDALKNAVRDYCRARVKNKPRAISGRVLARKQPLIGISSGRYKTRLDFFLEIDRIETYNIY